MDETRLAVVSRIQKFMEVIRWCSLDDDKKTIIEREEYACYEKYEGAFMRDSKKGVRIQYKCALCKKSFANRKFNIMRHLPRCDERHEELKGHLIQFFFDYFSDFSQETLRTESLCT